MIIPQLPVDPTVKLLADALKNDTAAIKDAIAHLNSTPRLEAGGFFLTKGNAWKFVAVDNAVPVDLRPALYEPSDDMSAVFDMIDEGWQWRATIHSHPAFAPVPSFTDLSKLFAGFSLNVIYSPVNGGDIRFYDFRGMDVYPRPGVKSLTLIQE